MEQLLNRKDNYLKIIKILKKFNLSTTKTRIKIINHLLDVHHFHSINEILEHDPKLNLKSIYNNLDILLRVGIVDVYVFNGISKYTIDDQILGIEEHIHIIHKNGLKIEHLKLDKKIINDLKKQIKSSCKIKNIKIYINLD